jgi:hypothetical protein
MVFEGAADGSSGVEGGVGDEPNSSDSDDDSDIHVDDSKLKGQAKLPEKEHQPSPLSKWMQY